MKLTNAMTLALLTCCSPYASALTNGSDFTCTWGFNDEDGSKQLVLHGYMRNNLISLQGVFLSTDPIIIDTCYQELFPNGFCANAQQKLLHGIGNETALLDANNEHRIFYGDVLVDNVPGRLRVDIDDGMAATIEFSEDAPVESIKFTLFAGCNYSEPG